MKRGLVRAAAHAAERLRLEQPRGGQGVCRRVVAHHFGDCVDEWRQEPRLCLLLLLVVGAASRVRAAEDDLGTCPGHVRDSCRCEETPFTAEERTRATLPLRGRWSPSCTANRVFPVPAGP